MRLFVLFSGLLAALANAQPPAPAIYQRLDITYRVDPGGKITETRTGEIVFNDSPLLQEFRKLTVPQRNRAGVVTINYLEIVGQEEIRPQSQAVQKLDGFFVWDIADAKPGDRVRFSVEQPVDPTVRAGAHWWLANSVVTPLPVKQGKVRLILPAAFSGYVVIGNERNLGAGYEWNIDGVQATNRAVNFTLTTFANYQSFAAWFLGHCPATPAPEVLKLAAQARSAADIEGRIAAAVDLVSQRIKFKEESSGALEMTCRPLTRVLASEYANEVEVPDAQSFP